MKGVCGRAASHTPELGGIETGRRTRLPLDGVLQQCAAAQSGGRLAPLGRLVVTRRPEGRARRRLGLGGQCAQLAPLVAVECL
eukprot:4782935-Prymnesium_polylepis.1